MDEEAELPNLGIHVITITVNDDPHIIPEIDYGNISPWVVTSILRAALEAMDILIPPMDIKSNGEVILSHTLSDEIEFEEFEEFDEGEEY